MKKPTPIVRASHVNLGTSMPRAELAWPTTSGRVMRLPTLHLAIDTRCETTPYGGLDLVVAFCREFAVAKTLEDHVKVLKQHQPYHESDHLLALACNLYVGGTCLEDLSNLQQSEAVKRLLGACRLPDPTTAGDFLRRFDDAANPGSLSSLRHAIDAIQDRVWRRLAKRRGKRPWATVDLDGHLKPLYGTRKEGADFSHTGQWSYHPLLVSLAESGDCVAVRNRSGNVRSSEGAAAVLLEVLPRIKHHARRVLVRGDSDFDRRDVREACEAKGAYFAFVGRAYPNRKEMAEELADAQWREFAPRAARARHERQRQSDFRSRQKKPNRRRQRAAERGYKALHLEGQWMAEVRWQPPDSDQPYRLVIRRQRIVHYKGQAFVSEEYRYRYVVTNLPPSWSVQEIIDETYLRCDQENVVEQMGSGIAAWRMPVGEFAGNSAWLEIGRLAWNLGKWIAQLALPAEVVRWEWKRFRQAFVFVSAQVSKRGRQIWVRLSGSHRFVETLVAAHQRLQM